MTKLKINGADSSSEVIEMRADLPVLFFDHTDALCDWMAIQPRDSRGVWLQLMKKGSGVPGISRSEAIDAALCYGWIDGQQQPYDNICWLVKFTPRRRGSKWSQINRSRFLELLREGRVQQAGLEEVSAAQADGRWEAAYAPASSIQLPQELQSVLDSSAVIAAGFTALKAGERYSVLYAIANAKRPETRTRQIARLIARLSNNSG